VRPDQEANGLLRDAHKRAHPPPLLADTGRNSAVFDYIEVVYNRSAAGEAPDRLQDVRVRADDGARAQRRLRERALAGDLARRALDAPAERRDDY